MTAPAHEEMHGALGAVAITPSDTDVIEPVTRAIWVGASGHLRVEMQDGTVATLNNAQQGSPIPLFVKRVFATGTTATDIVALY